MHTQQALDGAFSDDELAARFGEALAAFLSGQREALTAVGADMVPVSDHLAEFVLTGGKRLRPAFAYWGWRGAGGDDSPEIVRTAAALEWVQACALIHDDVIDRSETRRGKPATHQAFAQHHRAAGWRGDSDTYGSSMAILLGDLALIWAGAMIRAGGFSPQVLASAWPAYDAMRLEVIAGQCLDLASQVHGAPDVTRAMRVVRYKTAKYTVERPLHFGGALAGASSELVAVYSKYGLPLGEAFQLRDDVLGVFGDPTQTGKPAGGDLREGKRTALLAMARERTNQRGLSILDKYVGNPDLTEKPLAELRDIIVESGALAELERMISTLGEQAVQALDSPALAPVAATKLCSLVRAATSRDR